MALTVVEEDVGRSTREHARREFPLKLSQVAAADGNAAGKAGRDCGSTSMEWVLFLDVRVSAVRETKGRRGNFFFFSFLTEVSVPLWRNFDAALLWLLLLRLAGVRGV